MLDIDGPLSTILRDLFVVERSASRRTSSVCLPPHGRAFLELEKKGSRTAPDGKGRPHVSQCLQKDAIQGGSCFGAKAHLRLSSDHPGSRKSPLQYVVHDSINLIS